MTKEAVVAGQAVYSKRVLSIYDILVLGISNHLIWKCPTKFISKLFVEHVSDNHLDIGVGTGYYLKHHLSNEVKRIAIMDLNENSLSSTANAIQHLEPEVYRKNILEPLDLTCSKFDSVSINYLLHCLPGDMNDKGVIFKYIKDVMSDDAVLFGSTIIGDGLPKSILAKKLMGLYNKKGIFSNASDTLSALESKLKETFTEVKVEVIGCVALFSAKNGK